MKKLILIAPLALLAACQQQQPAPEATPSETATAMVSANGSPVGKYQSTDAKGAVTTTELRNDGTYTDTDADGKVTAEGTWAVTDGKTCFTPKTEGVEAMCYTESAPADDGSFTATPDKGDPIMVKPAASDDASDDAGTDVD